MRTSGSPWVKGEYPCTTQASGAITLAIDIGGAMKMGFGLHGTVIFYCKVGRCRLPSVENAFGIIA